MSKRLRTSIFLVLGVLMFVYLLAGCVESPAEKTPDATSDAKVGKLYTLQEALELSLLTLDDIRQIADYQNNNLAPEKPLAEAVALKIREARVAVYKASVDANGVQRYPNASVDDVSIYKYYGEYSGCYAVMLKESLGDHGQMAWTDIIDGVEIEYADRNTILVWSDKSVETSDETSDAKVGKFYKLREALELSLLTLDDIKQIADYHNNNLALEKPLDEAIARNIRETGLAIINADVDDKGLPKYPDASIDDVTIRDYYGEYNGCYAVMMEYTYYGYGLAGWRDIIDGVEIKYGDRNFIVVWTE